MTTFTSLVIESRWADVEKKLIAMQRKAAKLGMPPITFYTEPVNSPVYVYQDNDGLYSSSDPPDVHGRKKYTGMTLNRLKVVVNGDSPKFDGWKFVAKLTPTEDRKQNILMPLPGYDNPAVIPYVDKVGICEHCNQSRFRNDTFIVEHEDRRIKAVGRSCLKDFVGGATPEAIVSWAMSFFSIGKEIQDYGDDYYNSPSFRPSVGMESFIAGTITYISEYGWMSRQTANDNNGLATADMVWDHFCGRPNPNHKRPVIAEENFTTAKEIVAWMKEFPGDSSYAINIRTLAGQEALNHNSAGYVASAVALWKNNKVKVATEKDEYFGEVGGKYSIVAKFLKITYIPGYYGTKGLHIFQTKEGHRLTWFASPGTHWCAEEERGEEFDISFTIKKHELYRDKKQTLISHVKVAVVAK
jgi:hypothetical protein